MTESPKIRYTENTLKLLCGGIAGCCAKTTVAPFDRTKILLQGHNEHYKNMRPVSVLKTIRIREGVLGWYRGNGAQMIRIFPYSGLQFLSYDIYKNFSIYLGVDRWLSMDTDKLLCGALAGMTAVTCTYPLDVVRANLAFHTSTQDGVQSRASIRQTIRRLKVEGGGHRALYRGLEPTLLGMVPYAGLSFFTFERLKKLALSTCPHLFAQTSLDSADSPTNLNIPGRLACGSVAGLVAQTAAYPLDVARRNMQLATPSAHDGRHWFQVLVLLKQTYGFRQGLYRGLSLNYIRCFPMVAVSFTVYETLSQKMGILRH